MSTYGWTDLKVRDCHMAFSIAHLERGECISNVWGAKVIFTELANFSLI